MLTFPRSKSDEVKFMKSSTLLNSFLYLVFALICVSCIGCGPDFGEKLEIDGAEIYYKGGVTQADAQRLGDKLKAMKFIDGNAKSVQLLKRDDVWEFRMAVGKGGNSEDLKNQMKTYCVELSSAFDGDPVEVHICSPKLESKSVVKGLSGKRYQFQKSVYFYDGVDLATVKSFAAISIGTNLNPGGSTFHLSKSGDALEVRMSHVPAAKENKRVAATAKNTAMAVSNQLFDGRQVDVLICDPFFDSPKVFSSAQ